MFCNCVQRTGLAAVWEIEFRLPVTEVDDCNIADVLFISQIYNVKLELKLNSSTNVEAYSVKPKLQQTPCCMPLICNKKNHFVLKYFYQIKNLVVSVISID